MLNDERSAMENNFEMLLGPNMCRICVSSLLKKYTNIYNNNTTINKW